MNGEKLSNYNVLFVDDEMQVLKAIKRGLHIEKYNKFFANSGDEALEIIEKEEIAMIITDMKMPKMDGLALLKKVNEINPNIVKVILSGYTNLAQIIATINAINIYKFILKPWDLKTELKPIIIDGLEKYEENVAYINDMEVVTKKNELFKKLVLTNQQNYNEIENDFKNIKKLNKIITNYSYFLSLQLKEEKITKLRLKEELSFIDKIINDFIGTLPTLHRVITLKDLQFRIKNLIKGLVEVDQSERIRFTTDLIKDEQLPFSFVHLSWFIKMILKDIINISEESNIEIEVFDKEEDSISRMVIIIEVDQLPEVKDSIRKNTLYILSSAFAHILKGSFKIDWDNKSTITLKVNYN
jgi:YesN/AraC family two-component response regulator